MAANATNTFNADTKALNTLQNLPFDNLIAAPLNACVNAQAEAAQSTINFIQNVGLNEDENGNKEAVYVFFNFIQGGRRVTISVPLLTMVPIPYIAINTIDINFKATVTGMQNDSNTASQSYEKRWRNPRVKVNSDGSRSPLPNSTLLFRQRKTPPAQRTRDTAWRRPSM